MIDKEQAADVMFDIAERFGYDLEDEEELQQVGRLMMQEHPDFGQLFTEDLVALKATAKKRQGS